LIQINLYIKVLLIMKCEYYMIWTG